MATTTNNTSNISSPLKGMNSDLAQLNTDNTAYSFALNAITEGFWEGNSNFLSNEQSNVLDVVFPEGFQVVGFKEIHEQNRIIYFLTNPKTGHTQIGEVINTKYKDRTDHISKVSCDPCDYTGHEITPLEQQNEIPYNTYQIIAPFYNTQGIDCSGININFPIDIEYKITNCSLNIYFTDDLNERRFLYFDYTNNDLTQPLLLQDRFKYQTGTTGTPDCPQPVYINEIDCSKIKVHPDYEHPCIEFIDFVNGGNLKAGSYQVLICYSDMYSNPISTYFPASQVIPLWSKQITFETNYETPKALSFKITNLKTDSIFQYYNIVIAQTIEQFTEFILVGTFSTTQKEYTYNGFERTSRKLVPTEVFFRRPFYKTARAVTTANNYLFYTGVKEYPLLNLQPVANKVKLQWETVAIKEGDYRNPHTSFLLRTYQRDEVYAFGIVFEFDNGRETCAFHIPGREKNQNDSQIIDNNDVLTGLSCDDLVSCLSGLNIIAKYAPPGTDPANPCNESHNCNRAAFFVKANGVNVGLVNLNNNGPTVYCGGTYKDLVWEATGDPSTIGGPRTSTVSLTPNQILQVALASPDGSVTINLECATPVCGCHTEAAWMRVTNAAGQVLHDGCNNTFTFFPCNNKEKWEVYNTGTLLGGDYQYSANCQETKCWEYGDFAYWQSTETYPQIPEVWGDLCGKPIRHHKFPDSLITHIHDGKNQIKPFEYSNYIYPIGVRIDHQSVVNALNQAVTDGLITAEDRSRIKSYRIVRGNRVGNKSIDAKGLLFNMFKYDKFGKTYYFPNYAYNDLRSDDFLNNVFLDATQNNESQRFTFHSPDTHFVNAGLGNILKIETEERGSTDGYFTHSDCEAKQKFLSIFANTLAFGLGIAAAISATGEKQCKVITYKSDVEIDGEGVYPDVSGGSMINNPLININTNISTTGKTLPIQSTEVHNTAPIPTYDPITGQVVPSSRDGAEEQITTCKGQAFQLFVDPSGITNPTLQAIISFINAAAGGATELIQRIMLGVFEMNKVLDTLKLLIPYKNYGIQYNSVGKYNTYIDVLNNGNKLRKLDKTAYLDPYIQNVDEPSNIAGSLFQTIQINNWNRESSVYLKAEKNIKNPTLNYDLSKTSMSSKFGNNATDKLNERFSTPIASHYVSIKRQVLNQYGQLCNIEYLETTGCSFDLEKLNYTSCETKVFGGDTFINRFGLKRKMPFFLHTMCKLPDGSDVRYEDLSNCGNTKYFYNTEDTLLDRLRINTGLGGFANAILSIPAIPIKILASMIDNTTLSLVNPTKHSFDVQKPQVFYQDGYVDLFNYGIPYFLVESDVNVDFRHGQNNKDKDFYPHNTDLKTWFEEEYVPIETDNYYFYNRTYSKQNKESFICTSCILDVKDLTCQTTNYNRLIYSEPVDTENKNDNWLIFKANSYYDFPLTLGKLITADGIENDKVLVRLEKGTQIFNAYNTIQATGENIEVGTGGMFNTRPKDIAITDLGYAGTQHRSILHTEYGHIWADAERGQIFNLGMSASGIDEISKDGMKSWFKENLPFKIKEDFPQISNQDLDNNLNGIGLHYCFDKRFNRILITKLDYKVLDRNVKYDIDTKQFYIIQNQTNIPVSLKDTKYFCNKSWTISYSFYYKSWTSFHSYTPNFYTQNDDTFDSSYTSISTAIVNNQRVIVNTQKTYTHNATNKSYQVFYNKLYPYIIEFQSQQSISNNFLNSVQFDLDVIRYHNEFDTFYNQLKTFNKAIVYNNTQTSGLLHLKVSNPENLTEIEYPKRVMDGYEVLVTNSENNWGFNDFWDVTRNQFTNVPIFNYDCNNVNKTLNAKALNYDKNDFDRAGIRNKMCRVRLINDKESNYKMIFSFGQINQRQSFR